MRSNLGKLKTDHSHPNSRNMLTLILAIVSILIGLLSTLVMVVFFLAGAPNASPATILQLK